MEKVIILHGLKFSGFLSLAPKPLPWVLESIRPGEWFLLYWRHKRTANKQQTFGLPFLFDVKTEKYIWRIGAFGMTGAFVWRNKE